MYFDLFTEGIEMSCSFGYQDPRREKIFQKQVQDVSVFYAKELHKEE